MKSSRRGKDHSTSMILYLGLVSGLVGGTAWFIIDTMTRGFVVGGAFFADIRLKSTFLLLPIFFYPLAGLVLGLILAMIQAISSRRGKSVIFKTLPPYFPLFASWTVILLLYGFVAWERNNLQISRAHGPTFFFSIVSISFLPVFFALRLGVSAWRRRITRAIWLLVVASPVLVTGWSLVPRERVSIPPPPHAKGPVPSGEMGSYENVLLITIDTLRRDHLGCYGNREVRTPSIDRLAREGTLFTNCVAQAPITCPSHSSILTGTYPPYHGVRDNGFYRLGLDAQTIAERFRDDGYVTSAFVSAFPLDSSFGLDQGFDLYDDHLIGSNSFFFSRVADFYSLSGVMERVGIYHPVVIAERKAGETTKQVIRWLDGIKDRPFFLWVHFFDPHNPLNPPPAYEEMYAGSDLLARVGSPGKREAIRSTRDFTVYSADDPEVAYMKALYKAEVTYTDHYVGVLLDHLDQLGLAGHTLVVLTADHGQSLFEHDYVGHSGALYEQTIDVPLIFRGPHLIPAGKRVDGLVQSVDIVPTILDLLGMKPMEEVQGVSLAGRIRGMETPGEGNRPAYFETLHATSPAARYRGLSVDGWKLIRSEDGSVERLYRIDGDPGELEDLYRADSRKAAEMDSLLDDLIVKIRSGSQGKRLSIDRGTREILRSLGYVW